ncbi:Thylakoid membrane protein TERC [Picochlorum sp. SENEW3]|nr:Thylakoid membrane protein TERC [Picochlorum sp. SENEW3]WPT15675.1 Thylakoid membrane protein TERC [Picochlorum sp. SENEW3]
MSVRWASSLPREKLLQVCDSLTESRCVSRRLPLCVPWAGSRPSSRCSRGFEVCRAKDEDKRSAVDIREIDIVEPEFERGAESAALTVIGATVFGGIVWAVLGQTKAEEYFAGYLLEQSLSVDNLFVFVLVFRYFATPPESQKTVLSYGIGTAAILRLVLIILGADAVEKWKPILLVFSGILLYSSFNLLVMYVHAPQMRKTRDNVARFTRKIYFCSYRSEGDDEEDLSNNRIVKFSKSLFQFTSEYDGDKFFTSIDGKRVGTPLLLVLLVIEISDVIFAVDSIPAVFGVTVDPFVVYTSNIFAILSLRGLFGFVSSALTNLVYLEKSVATVLGFIGLKIILDFTGHTIPTEVSLGIVVSILGSGVIASLLRSKHD